MVGVVLRRFAVLVTLYVVAAWFAGAFILGVAKVSIFWPAAGVAFAAVIRYGWPWVLIIPPAVLLTHGLFVPVPSEFLAYSVASNMVGALAGSFVVLGRGMRPSMDMDSGLNILRGALVMALVASAIGTYGLVSTGMVSGDAAFRALGKWAMGDLLGILCVTPSILLLTAPASQHPDEPPARDYAPPREVALWAACLILSCLAVYLAGQRDSFYALGMVALPLTVLLWSAFRCQPIWTAAGTGVSVLFLTTLTGLGMAGFHAPVAILDVVLLLGFMMLLSSIPLVVAALVNQQRWLSRRMLRHANRDAAAQRAALEALVADRTRELSVANARLETASQTDPLTGLRNRRYLANQITADLAFHDREQARHGGGEAMLFALVDIDHFKAINDTHGHAAGDQVLRQLAGVLTRLVRTGDYVVRWGGEEFLIIFRPVSREHVPLLGERVRAAVEAHDCDIGGGIGLHVTCSVGLAEYPFSAQGSHRPGWEQMIELADAALYWVKGAGRNGWAVLRPTQETELATLMERLGQGAAALVADGQLQLLGHTSPA